jgi:hypothetical protein
VNGTRGLTTHLEDRVRALEIGHTEVLTMLRLHLASCDRRGAFHSALLIAIAGAIAAMLLKSLFHL